MVTTDVAVSPTNRPSLRRRLADAEQGYLVLAIAVLACSVGAATTDGFLTTGNFLSLLGLAAAFGILATGEAIVILGKGIDLSIAAIALGCAEVALAFTSDGLAEWQAIGLAVVAAVAIGLVNGVLVSYLEVPALFATLATGLLFIGGIDLLFLDSNLYQVGDGSAIASLTDGDLIGIPRQVLIAAATFILAWLFISFTSYGRLLRAMGDNFDTARATGVPVRPLQVMSYVASALLGLLAGFLTVSMQGSIQVTLTSFDPLLFTALTVAVIGGVSLAGGRGTIFGVVAGTLLLAVLNNLLILKGLSSSSQDLVRSAVLLAAIALDAYLHPRDVETAKTHEL